MRRYTRMEFALGSSGLRCIASREPRGDTDSASHISARKRRDIARRLECGDDQAGMACKSAPAFRRGEEASQQHREIPARSLRRLSESREGPLQRARVLSAGGGSRTVGGLYNGIRSRPLVRRLHRSCFHCRTQSGAPPFQGVGLTRTDGAQRSVDGTAAHVASGRSCSLSLPECDHVVE